MAIRDLIRAITGARESVADLNARIFKLRAERQAISAAPPHTDDLVEWIKRSNAAASAEYRRRLRTWYVPVKHGRTALPGEFFDGNSTGSLLAVPPISPSPGTEAPMWSGINPPLSLLALTYFLRDRIDERAPELVADLFPDADKGMRATERAAKLAKIDTEIAKLEGERDDLVEQLEAARGAAR
jgi:hypothetical protein